VLVDGSHWFVEPEGASDKWLAHQPVSLDILWWLRFHPFYQNLDDIVLSDERLAVDELLMFKREGGKAIVDLTNVGIGRDPDALVRVSHITGLHIVMGAVTTRKRHNVERPPRTVSKKWRRQSLMTLPKASAVSEPKQVS
jgi:phosphotriesterase-related protein